MPSLVSRVQFTDFRISHTKGNTTCTFLFTVDLINFNSMLPARYKQWTFWHDGNSSFQIIDSWCEIFMCVQHVMHCFADRSEFTAVCVVECNKREREREMFYLTTHSTHFIYGYMASDIWLRTILIVRKETRCLHIGYSYRLTARVILYAPSHKTG